MNMNIPTVEELFSPLAKFIHLAASDCGYNDTVKNLVYSWIHPLFLKAKATASCEDNPNWHEAMHELFADQFLEAYKIKIATLEGMEDWKFVKRTLNMNFIE